MNRLIIMGAGGHGKVIADIALKNGYKDIYFLDDVKIGNSMGLEILGAIDLASTFNDGKTDFVIGIGNNYFRKKIAECYDVNYVSLIHPQAVVGTNVSIGKGSVVMANAVINACADIGEHCIINTGAIVEHDNVIRDFVHISPNATLGGGVEIGKLTHVGIGSTVINNVRVCDECVIGGGGTVVKNIENSGTYVGVPVRMVR